MAQSGSASGLGPEGREFKSLCPDARSRKLDLLLFLLEKVIDGDRTLNGLAEYVEAKTAEFADESIEGAATVRSAVVPVLVRFSGS